MRSIPLFPGTMVCCHQAHSRPASEDTSHPSVPPKPRPVAHPPASFPPSCLPPLPPIPPPADGEMLSCLSASKLTRWRPRGRRHATTGAQPSRRQSFTPGAHTTLEATQGQLDVFWSQFPYTCHWTKRGSGRRVCEHCSLTRVDRLCFQVDMHTTGVTRN